MKKTVLLLITLISLFIPACRDEISYHPGNYFSLSATRADFDSNAGSKSLEIINRGGTVVAAVTAGDGWCTAQVSGNSLTVSVSENISASGRTAKIRVTDGDESLEVLVRQAQKYFSRIAAVRNAEAVPGPGEITLKWVKPEEDNFSHVIVTYEIQGQQYRTVVDKNLTEYTVKELLSSNGEHVFTIQSVDRDNDSGETVTVRAVPGKLVAFRFEKDPEPQLLPLYLRTSDIYTATVRTGTLEYDENVSIPVQFETDASLLELYNQTNSTAIEPLPESAYSLPGDWLFTGTAEFQDLNIPVNVSLLQDRKVYGLPLTVKPSERANVSEVMNSVILIFHVDDLAGWYTVDRLPNCGEGEGAYPASPADRRRYIKRTGDYTWETGYLFRSYANDENHVSGSTDTQYITLNPDTGEISIQQNGYPVSENLNRFDADTNELYIEYLYRDWAGWWTHEKMYNRSLYKNRW
jgi:hypothetical protein